MIKGYWLPVLHLHLPFVKHPEFDYFLEEHWLFEAISETYIPLLMKMKLLVHEGIDFRLTISISPTLSEMLADEYFVEKYLKHLDKTIELTEREVERLKDDMDFLPLARFYNDRFRDIRSFYTDSLNCNVLKGFRYFRDSEKIEIITSGATHGLLPLLSENPQTVEVQIKVAVDSHTRYFGQPPEGIWLPECAYYEGLDEILGRHDIKYFFLDTVGLMNGSPSPRFAVYAPVYTPSGLAVFGRDPLSSKQVWSSVEGYPGDFNYRDFYRDVGFDLDFDYIEPYISPDGTSVFTGIKYYRITGNTNHKEPYDPEKALEITLEHAAHFHSERLKQMEEIGPFMDRPPVVGSSYDAELFGHWWFEGPDFLCRVFFEIDKHRLIKAITPSEYLILHPKNQLISPCPSSWGDRGYYNVWLNEENDWIYRHLHFMADKLEDLANRHFSETDMIRNRILNQLTRELLLAQSSDWSFLMTTRTAAEYSAKRTREHISNFNKLLEGFQSDNIDMSLLEWLEYKNSIFEKLDFRVYASKP
jgi:1,4-alpha-glucan branching enzyme